MPASAMTARSHAATFGGTSEGVFTSAQITRCYIPRGRCTKAACFGIAPPSFDCDICALKMQCCPNMPARQVPRDVHEDARNVARRLMRTNAFLKSRDERKRVEMRFAHLKIHHGFERTRLRSLSGARDEFHLAPSRKTSKPSPCEPSGPLRSLPPASFA